MSAPLEWKLPVLDVSQQKQHLQAAITINVQITGMTMVYYATEIAALAACYEALQVQEYNMLYTQHTIYTRK